MMDALVLLLALRTAFPDCEPSLLLPDDGGDELVIQLVSPKLGCWTSRKLAEADHAKTVDDLVAEIAVDRTAHYARKLAKSGPCGSVEPAGAPMGLDGFCRPERTCEKPAGHLDRGDVECAGGGHVWRARART